MSDYNPTKNYVYQPMAALDFIGHLDPPIYGVGGPDVPFPCPKEWYGITKSKAQLIADELNLENDRTTE